MKCTDDEIRIKIGGNQEHEFKIEYFNFGGAQEPRQFQKT